MSSTSRREFIKFTGATAFGAAVGPIPTKIQAAPAAGTTMQYGGSDLAGWSVVVGDGIYNAPGQPPVTSTDIETIHYGTHSELRANLQHCRIMAHNITFQRKANPRAFDFVHTLSYQF